MVQHVFSIIPAQGGWAVLHGDKVLEVHAKHADAKAHVAGVARLAQLNGHETEVIVRDAGDAVESDRLYPSAGRP